MELDFTTIKALSSPTRIDVLRESLEHEATPTRLSESLGKSKSTVAAHLDVLVDAGLMEKEAEDGRKRVVYRPTRKAQSIVQGRERKVRFSVASSALSAVIGIGLLGARFWPATREQSGGMESLSMQATADAGAGAAAQTPALLTVENALLGVSLGAFGLAFLLFLYAQMLQRFGEPT